MLAFSVCVSSLYASRSTTSVGYSSVTRVSLKNLTSVTLYCVPLLWWLVSEASRHISSICHSRYSLSVLCYFLLCVPYVCIDGWDIFQPPLRSAPRSLTSYIGRVRKDPVVPVPSLHYSISYLNESKFGTAPARSIRL